MLATEPLPIHHSWPLYDRAQRLDLGLLHDGSEARWSMTHGTWRCDLVEERICWSDPVYDLFGLPRGTALRRSDALGIYAERSRAAMERLRAYAVRHRRGFTLDAELRPANGGVRWMRLIAVPVVVDETVVAIEGIKLDVTRLYA